VASSIEYRENSSECLGWAKSAKSIKEREIFLQMASSWLRAAVNLEASSKDIARSERATRPRHAVPLGPSDMMRRRAAP
jgi:hypothetical protein